MAKPATGRGRSLFAPKPPVRPGCFDVQEFTNVEPFKASLGLLDRHAEANELVVALALADAKIEPSPVPFMTYSPLWVIGA